MCLTSLFKYNKNLGENSRVVLVGLFPPVLVFIDHKYIGRPRAISSAGGGVGV